MERAPRDGARSRARVRLAYERVADLLRERIAAGELEPGTRLATEASLATEFGVSRATIREALRVLAAHDLISTTKGPTGGSFVTLPRVDHVSESMRSTIALLTAARHVSLEELLYAREVIEVPAARAAAVRRTEDHVIRLREAVPDEVIELTRGEQFEVSKAFHEVVMDACDNVLLTIALQPIFSVLSANLSRETPGPEFNREINDQHREIAAAIDIGDEDAAGSLMKQHLEHLRPAYESAWRNVRNNLPAHPSPARSSRASSER